MRLELYIKTTARIVFGELHNIPTTWKSEQTCHDSILAEHKYFQHNTGPRKVAFSVFNVADAQKLFSSSNSQVCQQTVSNKQMLQSRKAKAMSLKFLFTKTILPSHDREKQRNIPRLFCLSDKLYIHSKHQRIKM